MRKLAAGILLMLFCTIVGRTEESAVRRMAVLGLGDESEKIPGSLVALLEANLLEREDRVVLLERAEVDRLLREQKLGLMKDGEIDSEAAIQTGKIWGVDVFCLVSKTGNSLRVQMVDTWYGIRMFDLSLPNPGKNALDKTAGMFSGRILQALPSVSRDLNQLRMVGILEFRSMEPSRQWDDLSKPLRNAVEQQAVLHPALIVAEREMVELLLEERERVDHLPESIRSSVVLVNGEFHLDGSQPDGLRIYVQGKRHGQTVFRFEVKGNRFDLDQLGVAVASGISDALGKMHASPQMDPAWEGEMLLMQARGTRDPALALSAVAAAKALNPDDPVFHRAYLSEIERQNYAVQLPLSRFPWYLEECRRLMQAQFDEEGFNYRTSKPSPQIPLALCASVWSRYKDVPLDLQRESAGKLLDMYSQCWEHFISDSDWGPREKQSRLLGFHHMFENIRVPDTEIAFKIYQDLSKQGDERVLFRITTWLQWPDSLSPDERFAADERFYRWLEKQENLFLRMSGERGLARMYAEAKKEGYYAKARRYFEKFEHTFLYEYLPTLGTGAPPANFYYHGLPHWVSPFLNEKGFNDHGGRAKYYADYYQDRRYRADRAVHFLKHVYARGNSPQRIRWNWDGSYVNVLYETDRYQDIKDIYQQCIRYHQHTLNHFKGDVRYRSSVKDCLDSAEKGLHRLLSLRPELRDEQPKVEGPGYNTIQLLSKEEAMKFMGPNPGYKHLVNQHGITAWVGYRGVLFLDPDNFQPLRFEPTPEGIHTGSRISVDDSGIYTLSTTEILHFPPQGKVKVMFQNHPDLKVQTNGFLGMDVLKGRVYLLTSNAFMEFDPKQETRTLLLSKEASVKTQVVDRINFFVKLVIEPSQNKVHITCSSYHNRGENWHAVTYDPETKNLTRNHPDNVFPISPYRSAVRRGDLVYILSSKELGAFRLEEGMPELLRAHWPRNAPRSFYHRFALAADGFVVVASGGDVFFWQSPEGKMGNIREKIFSQDVFTAPRTADVLAHPKFGLVLLTSQGIFSVPDLKADLYKKDDL
ncbi:MAG: hypothetical protein WD708_12930 [Kiritimatiellia bacterium]